MVLDLKIRFALSNLIFALKYRVSRKVYLIALVFLTVLFWFVFLKPIRNDGNMYIDYWLDFENDSYALFLFEKYTIYDLIEPKYLFGITSNDRSEFYQLLDSLEFFKLDIDKYSVVSHYAVGTDTLAFLTGLDVASQIYVHLDNIKVNDFFRKDALVNINMTGDYYSMTVHDYQDNFDIFIKIESGYVTTYSLRL